MPVERPCGIWSDTAVWRADERKAKWFRGELVAAGLPARVASFLVRAGYRSWWGFEADSLADIAGYRGIGPWALAEIQALRARGRRFCLAVDPTCYDYLLERAAP